ncbi:MAG TPA: VWA domain-containing protein [Terriglobales bacterium]
MCILLLPGMLLGQQASTAAANPPAEQPNSTFSANVKVVNVLATVRDKHGKILSSLNKDDFALDEDAHPVTIQYFSRETDLPLTLGLLVDTSMSQRTVIDQERSASKTFLDQVLHEKDSGFLLHFDREVELLQDLTSSREKLKSAIESLQTRSRYDHDENSPDSQDDGSQRGGRRGGGGMRRGGTQLYDAIYLASDELMKKQPGRKAVVVLSDGVDRGSKETIESAIEAAQRSDTIVFAVYFKGEEPFKDHGGFGYPRMGGGGMGGPMGGGHRGGNREPEEQRQDGKKILERIAKETGGRMYEISKKDPLDQIYSNLEEELRNQYSLGFTPDKADSGGYHKIALKTKQKDTEVQTREGFYLDR